MGESVGVCVQNELGKGAFQELDQVKAVQQFCKYAGSASSAKDIVPTITAALKVSATLPLHPGSPDCPQSPPSTHHIALCCLFASAAFLCS